MDNLNKTKVVIHCYKRLNKYGNPYLYAKGRGIRDMSGKHLPDINLDSYYTIVTGLVKSQLQALKSELNITCTIERSVIVGGYNTIYVTLEE